eukprot:5286269-Prymnesium_polylepis.1
MRPFPFVQTGGNNSLGRAKGGLDGMQVQPLVVCFRYSKKIVPLEETGSSWRRGRLLHDGAPTQSFRTRARARRANTNSTRNHKSRLPQLHHERERSLVIVCLRLRPRARAEGHAHLGRLVPRSGRGAGRRQLRIDCARDAAARVEAPGRSRPVGSGAPMVRQRHSRARLRAALVGERSSRARLRRKRAGTGFGHPARRRAAC